MGRNDAGDQRPTRVHAIVLTRDRPQILKRCVDTALSALGPVDALTVLDDSCAAVSRANGAALSLIAVAGLNRSAWSSRTSIKHSTI